MSPSGSTGSIRPLPADDDSREYVERLEEQADSNEESLPSGDDLAGELEAFLREQQGTDGDESQAG